MQSTGLRVFVCSIYNSRPTGNADTDRATNMRYVPCYMSFDFFFSRISHKVESKRNSNDSRRTKPAAKPENTRRNCTTRRLLPVAETQYPQAPELAIRSRPVPPESVPTVVRSAISRPTKSTGNLFLCPSLSSPTSSSSLVSARGAYGDDSLGE